MKKLVVISLAVCAVVLFYAFRNSAQTEAEMNGSVYGDNKVEVYYFHFTRRCVTCQAVETEARKAVNELYPDGVKNGSVTFVAVNLDEESSKETAERCKVNGQALVVISGDQRVDLTSPGFMYAKNNPDKLKAEIKKTIDSMLPKAE